MKLQNKNLYWYTCRHTLIIEFFIMFYENIRGKWSLCLYYEAVEDIANISMTRNITGLNN